MGADVFESTINSLKVIVLFLLMVQLVPLLVWVERRGSAFIQNRLGPNRVGPYGLIQLLADAVKFLFKEDFVPDASRKVIYYLAPVIALIPAALAFGCLPLSAPIEIEKFVLFGRELGPYTFVFQGYQVGAGLVFVLGISSLGAYSLLLAGWGSGSKYSMYGALRASAQMISYELAMGLSIVGVLLLYGTFDFVEMISAQSGPLAFSALGHPVQLSFLPNWGFFYQPLGALLFFVAAFAETNRLPFDLPEAEAELVAGYHTEYGGFKMNMFYIGEYGHMIVAAILMSIFYFGGYNLPFVEPEQIRGFFKGEEVLSSPLFIGVVGSGLALIFYAFLVGATRRGSKALLFMACVGFSLLAGAVVMLEGSLGSIGASLMAGLVSHLVLLMKVFFFLWIFIWVRWTLPRFRYDQLMDFGWKTMLPWALFNALISALLIYVFHIPGGAS